MPSKRLIACLAACSAAAGGWSDDRAGTRPGHEYELQAACMARPAGPAPAAQEPRGGPQDQNGLARELKQLEERLQTPPRPSIAERERLLQAFLDAHLAQAAAPELLRAHVLLGGVFLQRLDLE